MLIKRNGVVEKRKNKRNLKIDVLQDGRMLRFNFRKESILKLNMMKEETKERKYSENEEIPKKKIEEKTDPLTAVRKFKHIVDGYAEERGNVEYLIKLIQTMKKTGVGENPETTEIVMNFLKQETKDVRSFYKELARLKTSLAEEKMEIAYLGFKENQNIFGAESHLYAAENRLRKRLGDIEGMSKYNSEREEYIRWIRDVLMFSTVQVLLKNLKNNRDSEIVKKYIASYETYSRLNEIMNKCMNGNCYEIMAYEINGIKQNLIGISNGLPQAAEYKYLRMYLKSAISEIFEGENLKKAGNYLRIAKNFVGSNRFFFFIEQLEETKDDYLIESMEMLRIAHESLIENNKILLVPALECLEERFLEYMPLRGKDLTSRNVVKETIMRGM
ncbi:hypothetical protein KAW38_00720 [Candidatus Micrarchaeota archaeon]|nr:hypothetical protein [Candidatus Micrarchaeota archaeon]